MANEDEKIVADYMGWLTHPTEDWHDTPVYFAPGIVCDVKFDLNDVAICVQEMQKRGEWQKFCATGFVIYFEGERPSHVFPENYIAWLFNAENFFKAFVEWRKGK